MSKLNIVAPCQVGDKAWVIDKDEQNKDTIYEAELVRVTLVQRKRNGKFEFKEGMRAAYGYWCLPVRCVDGVLRGIGGITI